MRLWTLHPKYLDGVGLVALWRESLLARAVLKGETRGYKHHPQLIRFQGAPSAVGAIEAYLRGIYEESLVRGYAFDPKKLARRRELPKIAETRGQLMAEWEHLMRKLKKRSPARYRELAGTARPVAHPLFRMVAGGVREWEKSGA
jgi:hypothetical protein